MINFRAYFLPSHKRYQLLRKFSVIPHFTNFSTFSSDKNGWLEDVFTFQKTLCLKTLQCSLVPLTIHKKLFFAFFTNALMFKKNRISKKKWRKSCFCQFWNLSFLTLEFQNLIECQISVKTNIWNSIQFNSPCFPSYVIQFWLKVPQRLTTLGIQYLQWQENFIVDLFQIHPSLQKYTCKGLASHYC